MKTATLSVLTIIVSGPTFASAQEAELAPPVSPAAPADGGGVPGDGASTLTHEGFMLRMSLGLALLGTGIEPDQSVGFGAGGAGQAINVSIGGYIARNLALHAELMGASSNHTVVASDDDSGMTTHRNDLEIGAAGLGMTYFVMPYNLSFTGALMLGEMNVDQVAGPSYDTDYAIFGKLTVAKEWAMSNHWGLGVGATALAGTGKGENAMEEDFDAGIGSLSLDLVASYD